MAIVCRSRGVNLILISIATTLIVFYVFGLRSTAIFHIAKNMMSDLKYANLQDLSIDDDIISKTNDVQVQGKHIEVAGRSIFFREAHPPTGVTASGRNVLLLHGMNFKSETWLGLRTIHLLAAMGHSVVAPDLPGYGETSGDQIPAPEKSEFLSKFLQALDIKRPVIVSPSMSGSFSLPFMFEDQKRLSGYVPVAPVGTEAYAASEYQTIQVPTLIIVGENDDILGDVSTKNLSQLPNSQLQTLPNAKHPAYLDQPALFHQLLYNFLLWLDKFENNN